MLWFSKDLIVLDALFHSAAQLGQLGIIEVLRGIAGSVRGWAVELLITFRAFWHLEEQKST